MELDKTIYYNKIKSVITLIYFIYVIIWVSKFHSNLPLNLTNDEIHKKGNHTIKRGISLLGGSNVRTGLSSEYISNKFYECYNFGISSEGGSFSEYTNFIGNRISSPDIVIYSPSYIWSDYTDNTNYFDFLPSYSIISQIKAFNTSDSNQLNFNSFGDQLEYNCGDRFKSFIINEQKFTSNNTFVISEIIRRVEKIKNLTQSDKVLIRIPPVYVNISNKKFISQNMIKRIKSLKESGIIVVGGTICSSDKSLFCDNFHPNDKGRKFFSIELKNEIKKILIGD